ncbi:MAG: hypothetical protein QNJ60_14230 [Xenococcaceae cyanobacterium MO_188.B19]|nr:hypothetical protein [Xenococcaceae cyanobacterium MO_188.B19]
MDIANNNLGLKQILQEQLLQAICSYRQQNKIGNSWDSIIVSMPEKLILCNKNNQKILTSQGKKLSSNPDYLVYRCAIAFPLANFSNIKPLDIAQELVDFFPQSNLESLTELYIKILVKIVSPGWIDFEINHSSLGIWLKQLTPKLGFKHINIIPTHSRDENLHLIRENWSLFGINYYHARCYSLLKLAEREELIQLDNQNFQSLAWQISNPHPIIWFDSAQVFLLTYSEELNLLYSILLILDRLDDRVKNSVSLSHTEAKIWIDLGLNLSKAFEQFMISCRFCGEIKHLNTPLAIARVGLIALVQWCLSNLLREKLQINPIPLKEL